MTEFWFGFVVGACFSAALVVTVASWILHCIKRDLGKTRQDLEAERKGTK